MAARIVNGLPNVVVVNIPYTGFNVLLAVVLGTWASDIFAYFGGRAIGRHKLAPAISPKKTVEGFVIGLACGVVVRLVDALRRHTITHTDAAIVGVAVSCSRRSATSSRASSSATSA